MLQETVVHKFFNVIHNNFHALRIVYFGGLLVASGLLTTIPILNAASCGSGQNSSMSNNSNRGNYKPEYLHVLSTGQSLSLGVYSTDHNKQSAI